MKQLKITQYTCILTVLFVSGCGIGARYHFTNMSGEDIAIRNYPENQMLFLKNGERHLYPLHPKYSGYMCVYYDDAAFLYYLQRPFFFMQEKGTSQKLSLLHTKIGVLEISTVPIYLHTDRLIYFVPRNSNIQQVLANQPEGFPVSPVIRHSLPDVFIFPDKWRYEEELTEPAHWVYPYKQELKKYREEQRSIKN